MSSDIFTLKCGQCGAWSLDDVELGAIRNLAVAYYNCKLKSTDSHLDPSIRVGFMNKATTYKCLLEALMCTYAMDSDGNINLAKETAVDNVVTEEKNRVIWLNGLL